MALAKPKILYVTPPEKNSAAYPVAIGTKTTLGEKDVPVISAKVTFEHDNFVQAEITVIADVEEVWALPFMSEESFLEAAKRYGYKVKKTP